MSNQIQTTENKNNYLSVPEDVIEKLVLHGDLSGMTPNQKVTYYNHICHSLGLNPATQPFAITNLKGKEVMYANKNCAEQLRKIYGVSIDDIQKQEIAGVFIVTVKGHDHTGRTDVATGTVTIQNLQGENLANALMKAETKAKRRLTLSICGLGMLDQTEVDDQDRVTVNQHPGSPQESNTNTVNIDLIDPSSPEHQAAFNSIINALKDERVPEKFDGITSNEQFINDLISEFNSGQLSFEKAQMITTALQKILS